MPKQKNYQTKMKQTLITMTLLSAITAGASAATLGVNSATAASWNDGDNTNTSGTPFGNWSLVANPGQGGFAGFFTGDSKDLDTGSGADINSPSTSFGMFGNQGGNADAFLVLSSALSVGQSLSFDLGVNFRNGNKGVDIRDGSDTVIFNFNIGTDDHVVNNATTGNGSTGNAYSANTAFNLSFTQTSVGGGNWTINRSGGTTDSDSGTYTGAVASLKLYNGADGGGAANNLFANSFTVVPEPSSAALLGLAGLALILRRRK